MFYYFYYHFGKIKEIFWKFKLSLDQNLNLVEMHVTTASLFNKLNLLLCFVNYST